VAQDAGLATPIVNDAVEAAGGDVEFSREYRPSFDEVFAALVARAGAPATTNPAADRDPPARAA
jgi:hypothetical protein